MGNQDSNDMAARGSRLPTPICSADPLYSPRLRALIDGWLDGPILRNMGFGFQLEHVRGWLQGHPGHLTGVERPITEEEAVNIIFSYFHDSEAAFVLDGYGGSGGLINFPQNDQDQARVNDEQK